MKSTEIHHLKIWHAEDDETLAKLRIWRKWFDELGKSASNSKINYFIDAIPLKDDLFFTYVIAENDVFLELARQTGDSIIRECRLEDVLYLSGQESTNAYYLAKGQNPNNYHPHLGRLASLWGKEIAIIRREEALTRPSLEELKKLAQIEKTLKNIECLYGKKEYMRTAVLDIHI